MNKILCNDIVSIDINYTYENYSNYTEWLDFYSLSKRNYICAFGGFSDHFKNSKTREDFVVEWIAPHLKVDKTLYLIKGRESGYRFIVGREAIKDYYHTHASVDKSDLVNQIIRDNLNKEIEELNNKNSIIEEDNKIMKEKLRKLQIIKNNPMPLLENGMFGITKGKTDEDTKFFVVVKKEEMTYLIYQNGGYDKWNENALKTNSYDGLFNRNGIYQDEHLYFEISCLIKANSFEEAQLNKAENIIWKRN